MPDLVDRAFDVLGGAGSMLGFGADGQMGQEGSEYRTSRRGRTGTKTGMIAMPARMPNKRQWDKINKRLHDYRAVSIQILRRTGGANLGRESRGSRPYYPRTRRR